jgi:hypothetical protein
MQSERASLLLLPARISCFSSDGQIIPFFALYGMEVAQFTIGMDGKGESKPRTSSLKN